MSGRLIPPISAWATSITARRYDGGHEQRLVSRDYGRTRHWECACPEWQYCAEQIKSCTHTRRLEESE